MDEPEKKKVGRKKAFKEPVEKISGYLPKPIARRFKMYLHKQDEFKTLTELLNHILSEYLDKHDPVE